MTINKAHRDLLKANYIAAVSDYCRAFCNKHDLVDYDPTEWVADEVGGIVMIGDLYVDFDDIKYDIDHDLPEDMYMQYYDYSLEVCMLEDEHCKMQRVNYENFSKGFRPYSEEQLQQIKKAKQRADEAKAELVRLCEQMQQKGGERMSDMVNHPPHYTQGGIECIDAMLSAFGVDAVQDYCICNAFKYLWRHKHKGKMSEDVSKAQWYLNKWLEIEKGGEE